jgi:hypothetical protein
MIPATFQQRIHQLLPPRECEDRLNSNEAKSARPLPRRFGFAPGSLIARAKSFELDTPYVPPPETCWSITRPDLRKFMCSAVYMTRLSPEFAAENVGYFTGPYRERAKVGKPVIDHVNQAVHITPPNGVTRTAKYLGNQGKDLGKFHAPRGQERIVGCINPAMTRGGRAARNRCQWRPPAGEAYPEDRGGKDWMLQRVAYCCRGLSGTVCPIGGSDDERVA